MKYFHFPTCSAITFVLILAFSSVAEARWYDPYVGRFVSRDPQSDVSKKIIEPVSNERSCSCGSTGSKSIIHLQVSNPYLFTTNSPSNYTDPDGEWVIVVWPVYEALAALSAAMLAYTCTNPAAVQAVSDAITNLLQAVADAGEYVGESLKGFVDYMVDKAERLISSCEPCPPPPLTSDECSDEFVRCVNLNVIRRPISNCAWCLFSCTGTGVWPQWKCPQ